MIGQGGQLDGKYEILHRLGSGGMGEVYLVRHNHLQQLRVVKVLRADLATDEAAGQRFQHEARTAIKIKHPNVATLYDYAQLPDGRYYMVWEHIEGEDLGASLKRQGPMNPAMAIETAIQALRGLDAIHSAGVIHRDISPDNLMVTRDNRDRYLVKIIDLGLAKSLGGSTMELTQAGTFLGKLQYCSPEQAGYRKDQALDHRSDLYSLALVLYEMLCGLPPFESESQHGYVLKRLSEEPMPLLARNPQVEIPKALAEVVMQGLERDRENRFADATSFIKALATVGEPLGRGDGREGSTPVVEPPPTAPVPPAPKKPADLTREERIDLLAQIEKAASRVRATSQHMSDAETALREGRFEEARSLIKGLEEANPRLRGLAELKARLLDAEQIARRRQQVMQAEQMLEKYLLEKQQTLASLALETLLGLYPNHPRRSDYQTWVKLLGEEAEEQKSAEKAFAAGREAIARDDLQVARRQLAILEKHELSGKLAGTLLADINEAERKLAAAKETDAHREAFERSLAAGDLAGAGAELDALSALEMTRVTLDLFRSRLDEASATQAKDEATASFEERFRGHLDAGEWRAARDVATEMREALPGSARPSQMFAEIGRAEEAAQREQAVQEGLRRFDGFLVDGQLAEAELALKILKQLAGDRKEVADAERRLAKAR